MYKIANGIFTFQISLGFPASKIATLLVDAGVNNDRLLGKSCILENENKVPPAFTSTELKNMRNYRALAKFQAQKLFEQIANLAQ